PSRGRLGERGKGRTGGVPLPPQVVRAVRNEGEIQPVGVDGPRLQGDRDLRRLQGRGRSLLVVRLLHEHEVARVEPISRDDLPRVPLRDTHLTLLTIRRRQAGPERPTPPPRGP